MYSLNFSDFYGFVVGVGGVQGSDFYGFVVGVGGVQGKGFAQLSTL